MDIQSSKVDALLDNLRQRAPDRKLVLIVLERVARKIGAAAEASVSAYPPPSGKPMPAVYDRIDAQGNPYKSKFKRGEIRIPYRRTGRLGASITSDIEVKSADASASTFVGTNVAYAPYVIGTPGAMPGQAPYHTGTWTPLEDDLLRGQAKITSAAEQELDRAVNALIP
jgi:hypothetical protein